MEKEYHVCLFWSDEEVFIYKVTSTSEKEAIEKAIQEATLIDGWVANKEGAETTLNRVDRIIKIVCVDSLEKEKERKLSAQKLRERLSR